MSTTTTRKLNMTFGNDDGSKKFSLNDPLADLDGETVSGTMNEIVELETLVDNSGKLLNLVEGAELETVTKQTLF